VDLTAAFAFTLKSPEGRVQIRRWQDSDIRSELTFTQVDTPGISGFENVATVWYASIRSERRRDTA